ncbi:SDR family oxidoreductase [Limoniibacter endophyticus]|uniref:Short-chain dehydrogenase/reductase n=1 Tax=Limoniibacter endophyticus TaxID=1565040 RepID=A0A8J3DRV0_9HYPH|nr:SDR family oxidoreductase [Limoniibacter endophyticus]GHC76247.1 short-chain dehydrogenase/reductase [Limoniibacter endophyticus]
MKESRKTILVTGASSGIGAYCARALAKDGWRVFATARKPEDIAALQADGIETFYLDYGEPASIPVLVDLVLEKTGGTLDALYNNGAYAQAGAVEDLPTQALRDQFETNVFGWHELTRRIVPTMRKQGHGRIVQCSSILGLMPVKYRGAYSASKHAIEALALCLRAELQGSGIEVCLIEPGPITSKIASNGLPWFERYIDHENSAHRDDYKKQLERLRSGGTKSRFKLGPEAVYVALKHALTHPRPRPHSVVTTPARLGVLLKRLLPARIFYKVTASQG